MYPFPSSYITHLSFSTENSLKKGDSLPPLKVTHANESSYIVENLPQNQASMIVLSQGYDAGWHAYLQKKTTFAPLSFLSNALPFLFGEKLQHSEVNNWENGWNLPAGSDTSHQVVIFYLPQLLETAGFVVLVVTLFSAVWLAVKKKKLSL
jgi:hypothetical protein